MNQIWQLINLNWYEILYHRAWAEIKYQDLPSGDRWRVGWVQACTDAFFRAKYGSAGFASCEIPKLMSGNNTLLFLALFHFSGYQVLAAQVFIAQLQNVLCSDIVVCSSNESHSYSY